MHNLLDRINENGFPSKSYSLYESSEKCKWLNKSRDVYRLWLNKPLFMYSIDYPWIFHKLNQFIILYDINIEKL